MWIDLEGTGREVGLFFRESIFEKGEAGEEMLGSGFWHLAQKLFGSLLLKDLT